MDAVPECWFSRKGGGKIITYWCCCNTNALHLILAGQSIILFLFFSSFYITTDISESLNTALYEIFSSHLSQLEGGVFALEERNNCVVSAGPVDSTRLEQLLSVAASPWETIPVCHREKIKSLDTDLFCSAVLYPFHGSA